MKSFGKKLFEIGLFFGPLDLYRWRIGNSLSFSLSQILFLLSFIILLKKINFQRSIIIISIILFLILGGLMTSIIVFPINSNPGFLTSYLFGLLTLILVADYIKDLTTLITFLKILSFSSIWLLLGILLQARYIVGYVPTSYLDLVPLGKVLHISVPRDYESTMNYVIGSLRHLQTGILRVSYPFGFTSSGAGLDSSIIALSSFSLIKLFKIKNTNIHLFFSLISTAYVILTGSRSAFFLLLCGILLMYMFSGRNKIFNLLKFVLQFTIFLVIILLLLSVIGNYLDINLVNTFLERLLDPSTVQESTQGHLETRIYALNLFANRPFFGYGLGGYELMRGEPHPHSLYFMILAENGIFGEILFLIFILFPIFPLIKFLRKSRTLEKKEMRNTAIFALSLVISVAMASLLYQFVSKYFFISLAISWSTVYMIKRNNQTMQKNN